MCAATGHGEEDEDESSIRLVSNILPSLHGTSDSRGV